tara:strand:+ start:518 stop:907 length:390 start_codon:yes stop_codon:yes gene_type:complete
MKNSKMSKDKKSKDLKIERQKAVDFAMCMRGQMLIGKALHYGMIKIMEVEKDKAYFKNWEKEIEKLKSQTPLQIDKIKKKSEYIENYKTSDVEDLEYIAENLYAPWIEMCKFTEQFDEGDLNKLLKSEK